MLPSLSGLLLAPSGPRHAAPAIGMDGDGEAGPSSMQVWEGSRGMGEMDMEGMLVGFNDEDTGLPERGVVTADDGAEVTVLLKNGRYKIFDKDDVTPLRRATPEEIQAPAYRDPAPAPAAAPNASTDPPAKPLPEDLKAIEEEIKRVSAETEVRRNAVVATITSYQEDIEAADAAQKEWKKIKEQKERAKIEETANVPGAKEKLAALANELTQANAKKLALLKKTKEHNDTIARALGQLNLYLDDLKQKKTRLAQQSRDASANKRALGEVAKAEQEEAKRQRQATKEAQDQADVAEAAALGITIMSLKSKRSRQKSAAKAAGHESHEAYMAALQADAEAKAARTQELRKEQEEHDAEASIMAQKAEQCTELICQVRELRSQMEEVGTDFQNLLNQIEERGNCGLDQEEGKPPYAWMKMLAAKAMQLQEEVLKMGEDYPDEFELRDAATKLAECRQTVQPLHDANQSDSDEGSGDEGSGDEGSGDEGSGDEGGGNKSDQEGGEGGEDVAKVSRAPDSKGNAMSVQKRVGHLEAWSSKLGRDGLFGGAQAGDDDAMDDDEARWFAEGDDPEYDEIAYREAQALKNSA